MQLAENINKKWAPVLDHPDLPEIKDAHRRAVTAMCLENVESQYAQDQQTGGLLSETVPVTVRGQTTASPSDGTGIASETLIHSTGVNTLYINANYNGPILTGAVCGIYTATATETNYFCGSTMTGESGTESGNIKATDSNAMLICQEIFQ